MPSPEKFRETFTRFNIDPQVLEEIDSGFEDVTTKTKKSRKLQYFARAVDIMDEKLDFETKRDLMDENGCCKSGARLKNSKAFAKKYAELSPAERAARVGEAPNMGAARFNADGTLCIDAVKFWDGEKFLCPCPSLNADKRDISVSRTYCMCCAGHFRFHYEIMLGIKLKLLSVDSSPLDTSGKEFCGMTFEVVS